MTEISVDDLVTSLETEIGSYRTFESQLDRLKKECTVFRIIIAAIFATGVYVLAQYYSIYFLYAPAQALQRLAQMLQPLGVILGYTLVLVILLPYELARASGRAEKHRAKYLSDATPQLRSIGTQIEHAITKEYLHFSNNIANPRWSNEQTVSVWVEQTYPKLNETIRKVRDVLKIDSLELFNQSTVIRDLNAFKHSLLSQLETRGRVDISELAKKLKIKETTLKGMLQSLVKAQSVEGYLGEHEFVTKERLKEELRKEIGIQS